MAEDIGGVELAEVVYHLRKRVEQLEKEVEDIKERLKHTPYVGGFPPSPPGRRLDDDNQHKGPIPDWMPPRRPEIRCSNG